MENISYKAFVVEEISGNKFIRKIKTLSTENLPRGDLFIRVRYSSLNYKDALSATGNRGVTKNYPHTPGIDAAGTVEESSVENFRKGDRVIVTGYDLGMNTSGGFGEYIRVPADWAIKLPDGLSLKQSMIFGTAGFTAGMSVYNLTRTISPDRGRILVTGATGGVGSIASGILSFLGYHVTGVSGKSETGILDSLGVRDIIDRREFVRDTSSFIMKARWAGAVDTVGGDILATAIKSVKPFGVVTCCGNVASPELPINVFPFILRGISLVGMSSQNCPMNLRKKIWKKLSRDWKFEMLESIYTQISLEELDDKIEAILEGRLKGRTLLSYMQSE